MKERRGVIISQFTTIDVNFKDSECLVDALKDLGYHPEIHEGEGVTLENSYSKIKPKAHIRVKKSEFQGYGDLGFEKIKGKNSFRCHIDDSDSRKIKINKIKQYYASRVIQKTVRRNSRFSLVSKKEVEGEIKIRVRRY